MSLMTTDDEREGRPRNVPYEGRELDPTKPDTWPAFMTVDEVAFVLRVTAQTVRRRIKEGFIPAVDLVGKSSQRIPRDALLRSLKPE